MDAIRQRFGRDSLTVATQKTEAIASVSSIKHRSRRYTTDMNEVIDVVLPDQRKSGEKNRRPTAGKEKPFERPLANTDCKPPIIRL
ncbi:DUF4113 domain-containing protein [Porphyromonas gingivalis]|uniref:DUF4113 domain-containing protein n=1 Tax=Porphyromonas gingivalis TaxID=837 RepID=UPI00265AE367|nr:DUF4113 domain-containing protein [Porphyromonas gingivalis]MDP0625542.1 DUF4113 domain-containing protein [Porphyromonas gingivalis]WKD53294.1 DUF4113 domain-containing protein [Porphyromonas gingivalis]WKD55344.1 DUF4113 domain-containing protein [Porphyromonas gingivalis]